MRKRTLAPLPLAVVLSCGGGGPSNVVNGTVAGQSMTAADAISNVLQADSQSAAGILITSVAHACPLIGAQQLVKDGKELDLVLGTETASGLRAPTSGVYTVYSSGAAPTTRNVAFVRFTSTDASCVATTSLEAESGTITLSDVYSTAYSGTFDVTFPNGAGHLTGSFATSTCPPLGRNVPSMCPP